MAEGVRFTCPVCGEAMESWSDGNAYYLDASGCSVEEVVSSRVPRSACGACRKEELVAMLELEEQRFPRARGGASFEIPISSRSRSPEEQPWHP